LRPDGNDKTKPKTFGNIDNRKTGSLMSKKKGYTLNQNLGKKRL